jgi:MFS family permease
VLHLDLIPGRGAARRLAVLTLSQSAGSGLFLTSSAVFFVKVVGLPPGAVGIGMSLAALGGLLCAVPVGKLADRYGPRSLLAASHAALVVLYASYPLVHSFPMFVVVAALTSIAASSGSALRSAMIHDLFSSGAAVRTRAQLRGVYNAGFMLGAAVSALALAAGTHRAFWAVSLANAAAQVVCAAIAVRLKAGHRVRVADGPSRKDRSALRDVRFLLVTLGNGLMELHGPLLVLGMPLWIVAHTRAPAALNAALVVTNTLLTLLLQVRFSRGADSVAGAARLQRRAGLVLAAGCVVCATSQADGPVLSTALLVAGTVVLCAGELYQSAGGWGLSFELPPPGSQGEYQAVFGLGRSVQQFVGPALVTSLVVGVGAAGWLVMGLMFLAVGAAVWKLVDRPSPPAELSHSGAPNRRTGGQPTMSSGGQQ